MRGLFYVHLYGAFEYSIDQCFIRLAQHIAGRNIEFLHLNRPVYSIALEGYFTAFRTLGDWTKRYRKRVDMMQHTQNRSHAVIPDTVLSPGMQSVDVKTIALAFDLYGIPENPIYTPAAGGYINEVVERRHAVAHGRESPVSVGVLRVVDLRKRYEALYNQAGYVVDTLNAYIASKKFVSSHHRAKY